MITTKYEALCLLQSELASELKEKPDYSAWGLFEHVFRPLNFTSLSTKETANELKKFKYTKGLDMFNPNFDGELGAIHVADTIIESDELGAELASNWYLNPMIIEHWVNYERLKQVFSDIYDELTKPETKIDPSQSNFNSILANEIDREVEQLKQVAN